MKVFSSERRYRPDWRFGERSGGDHLQDVDVLVELGSEPFLQNLLAAPEDERGNGGQSNQHYGRRYHRVPPGLVIEFVNRDG